MNYLSAILETIGAVATLATALGVLLPKGSRVGGIAAKVGADLKNHTQIQPAPAPRLSRLETYLGRKLK